MYGSRGRTAVRTGYVRVHVHYNLVLIEYSKFTFLLLPVKGDPVSAALICFN